MLSVHPLRADGSYGARIQSQSLGGGWHRVVAIESPARAPRVAFYSRSTGETVDDASITAKVKSKLLADPDVKGLDTHVNTFRGTVQLTGFVDSQEQKMRAEQLSRQVSGVQSVQNDLIVKTEEPAGAARK